MVVGVRIGNKFKSRSTLCTDLNKIGRRVKELEDLTFEGRSWTYVDKVLEVTVCSSTIF